LYNANKDIPKIKLMHEKMGRDAGLLRYYANNFQVVLVGVAG